MAKGARNGDGEVERGGKGGDSEFISAVGEREPKTKVVFQRVDGPGGEKVVGRPVAVSVRYLRRTGQLRSSGVLVPCLRALAVPSSARPGEMWEPNGSSDLAGSAGTSGDRECTACP